MDKLLIETMPIPDDLSGTLNKKKEKPFNPERDLNDNSVPYVKLRMKEKIRNTDFGDGAFAETDTPGVAGFPSEYFAIDSNGLVRPSTAVLGGWYAISNTLVYSSADDPTYVVTVSGDYSQYFSAGARIKLTQSTTKYFIVTAISYSSSTNVTTITLYGGTDYDVAITTISDAYFSPWKAPVGFPLDPTKWTVELSDTTGRSQSNPTANTWYNLGSLSISIPIGVWNVSYNVQIAVNETYGAAGIANFHVGVTLSTANNSESDVDFSSRLDQRIYAAAANNILYNSFTRAKTLSISNKTVYYINTMTNVANQDAIYNNNDTSKLFIRAISAYL